MSGSKRNFVELGNQAPRAGLKYHFSGLELDKCFDSRPSSLDFWS